MRLPWIETTNGDDFAPLRSVDWQIHIYGKVNPELTDFSRFQSLELHEFPWEVRVIDAIFKQDTLYFTRPDDRVRVLNMYLKVFGIIAFEAE